MRSINLIFLLPGAVVARSTIEIFNIQADNTILTFMSADAAATTYEQACPSLGAAVSSSRASHAKSGSSAAAIKSATSSAKDLELVPISNIPLPTAKARLRRQQSDDNDDAPRCEPYTLVQGASTWEAHMTLSGVMTVDMNCNWSGESKSAEWTCTGSSAGALYSTETGKAAETDTLKQGDLLSIGEFATATVENAPTGFGLESIGTTPSASSSAGPQQQTSGLAAPGPLPTGVMGLVGGAAGVLAAALAL